MEEDMKNTFKWLALVSLLLVVVMSFALVSCGGDGDDTNTDTNQTPGVTTYTVTFKQADGTEEKVTVEAGKAAVAPALKQFDGYTVSWENVDFSNVTSDMTVNALKTAVEYTITYELDGGVNHADNVANSKYTVESAKISLANPAKTGYKFLGWYSDAEFTTAANEIAAGSMGNKTFYANWELITYTITYELNGGENSPANPKAYDISSADIALVPATLDGYDFVGWYLDQAFTKPCDTIVAGTTGNIKLYARYDLERYAIEYNLNGGRNDKDNPEDYNKNEAVTFKDPTKNGFEFKGWFTDRDCTAGNEITGINKGENGIVAIYAKWEIKVFNLEYVVDSYAEVNPANPSSYTVETVQELADPLNIKPGYSFDGWYTERAFKNQVEEIKDLFNITKFYAKFTPITYDIVYEERDGKNADENPVSYTVENVGEDALAILPAVRKGFKFLGWFMEEDCSGEAVTVVPADKIGGFTLYAGWEIETYNITYVLFDGTNAPENVATYTVNDLVTFANATKEGTYLIGWFTDEAFTKPITSTDGLTGDITVYARWFDKYNDPTMKFDTELIQSITANEENERKDSFDFMKLFDGVIAGGNYYGAGDTEWFGNVGYKITIVFKEEVLISQINIGGTGSWTYGKICAYDTEENEIATSDICFKTTNVKVDGVITPEAPIKVKTITIEVTGLKWTDQSWTSNGKWSFKVAEVEILVANPDYNPAA